MSDQFGPGDVVYLVPWGNRNGRRILVEEIDEDRTELSCMVWGVEVSSRFWFRGRRGVRPLVRRVFWLWLPDVRGVVPASDERVTALRERLAEIRGRGV